MQVFTIAIATAILAQACLCIMRPIHPVHDGTIDTERLDVLKEIFSACFEDATKTTVSVWRIRSIERTLGYISRVGVNYVFATLGYLPEDMKAELEKTLCERGREDHLYQLPIKAKMSSKLLNRISGFDHDHWRVVREIEQHTGKTLTKTRDYLTKYE